MFFVRFVSPHSKEPISGVSWLPGNRNAGAATRSEYYRVIRHTVNSVEGLIEEVQQSAEHVGTSAPLEQLRGQVVGSWRSWLTNGWVYGDYKG